MLVVLSVAFFVAPTQAVSATEGRALAPWPAFTFEDLKSGLYTRALELYVADHFPLRDDFVGFTAQVRSRFGIRRDATVYATSTGALGGFEATDWRPPAATDEPETAVERAFGEPDSDAGDIEIVDSDVVDAGTEAIAEATEKGGVVIHAHRGMMLLSATDDTARAFARVLATYAAAFPTLRVYAVIVPGAGAFYLPASHRDRGADERHNLETIRKALPSTIHWVDVLGALEQHTREPIYYRTDHHWTGLGAFYAAQAMVEAAGLPAATYEAYDWKTLEVPTLGSLSRMTQDPELAQLEDVTTYPQPRVAVQAVAYAGPRYDVPRKRAFLDPNAEGYLVYLGGDVPLMAAKTEVKNGRRALLVKNSFGNPLGPLLLPHFEQVVVVDYRHYFGTIASLVKRFRITDVFLQNATLTANDPYHRGRMKLALFTTVSFTDAGVVYGR